MMASLPLFAAPARADDDIAPLADFDARFSSAVNDPDLIDLTHRYRELDFRQRGPTAAELRARPQLSPLFHSDKPISSRARDLIILFEVSGSRYYELHYRSPTWPQGRSGITIGIGYDLGYVTSDEMERDWAGMIDDSTVSTLQPFCGIRGDDAASLVAFASDVSIPWTVAVQQFSAFLSNVAGETVHTFPGCEALGPDSFGALVSLVYNRGGGLRSNSGDPLDRRREMRAIRADIASGDMADVPVQIRSMRRIWSQDRNAAGLVTRRTMEADLFAAGLRN